MYVSLAVCFRSQTYAAIIALFYKYVNHVKIVCFTFRLVAAELPLLFYLASITKKCKKYFYKWAVLGGFSGKMKYIVLLFCEFEALRFGVFYD